MEEQTRIASGVYERRLRGRRAREFGSRTWPDLQIAVDVTRMIASVGSWIDGCWPSSVRASRVP